MSAHARKDDDQWLIARNRRLNTAKKRRLPHSNRRPRHIENCPPDENDPDRHPVHKIIPRMAMNEWYMATVAKLRRALKGRKVQSLICLGMGSMASQKNARHQFACAVNLATKYEPSNVMVYDPVMTKLDGELVSSFGWRTGKNEVDFSANAEVDDAVLVFMPHCHRVLVQRIVAEMRARHLLANAVFLGNSIRRSPANLDELQSELEHWYLDILRSDDTVQMDCGNGCDATFERAFNDLAVTTYAPK